MNARAFDINSTALPKGTLLLEASAGTGKTWSLTSIAARLILEGTEEVERILLVTFTRKATDELRQRLRARLHETEQVLRGTFPDDDKLKKDHFLQFVQREWRNDPDALERITRARRDVDLARVRTIHQFCREVLAEGAFEAGLPLDGAQPGQSEELVETAWRDSVREFVLTGPPVVAALLKKLKSASDGLGEFRDAMREATNPWLPAERPFDEVLAAFERNLAGLDFTELGRFADGLPADPWVTHGTKEIVPLIELLRDGLDPGRADHCLALLELKQKNFEKGLRTKHRSLLGTSPAGALVARVGAMVGELEVGLRQGLCRHGLTRYQALKESLGLIDYDDLIAETHRRLADPAGGPRLARRIGDRFDAALVDEFQDTDGNQWEVFRRIFTPGEGEEARHVLVLVGDPKQAIYRFRGADIYAYLAARGAADDHATLTKNWRSTPGLVEAVNSVFGRRPDESFALEQIRFEPVEPARERGDDPAPPLRVAWVDVPEKANEATVQRAVLERLVADVLARRAEVPPGKERQLAVLVWKHEQARAVMHALREVHVDAILARGGDIHESEAMGEWRVILRALLDPTDLGLQRRARATRIWGRTLSALDVDGIGDIELAARLRRTWLRDGVATMATELLGVTRAVPRLLAEGDGTRTVTDIRHAIELLNREEASRGLGPEALLRWAESELRSTDPQNEERPLRLDRQSDAVQILTNFTSKGLEFDTVFLPFAWHRTEGKARKTVSAHDDAGQAVFDFRADSPLVAQARLEATASDLRMHYVELTRAKERCVVYMAAARTWFNRTPAALLLAGPDDLDSSSRASWIQEMRGALEDVSGARETVEERVSTMPAVEFCPDPPDLVEATPLAALEGPRQLVFPEARRGSLVPWRQLSYTALVHSLHGRLEADPVELPLTDRADPSDAPVAGAATGIFGFARGARAGICLHELLEKSEFSREVDDTDRRRVEKLLARHGLALPSTHPGEVDPVEVGLDLIGQVRREGLPFGGAGFDTLQPGARLDEWQFNLPVVDLVPARIAALVRQHWTGEEWIAHAADRLSRLPTTRLQGMLGGFVDLLFTDGERWTVLDWKSNDLGSSVTDYTQPAMQRAMIEHDYVVQLLFYLVATHRFLRTRIADYDYDRHVSGASYVFLRGLCGDPRYGWCNVAPPRALIEAIDDLFAGGRG